MMGRPLVDAEALRRLHFLNRLQSVILLVGLLALAAAPGLLLAGPDGLVIAAFLAAGFLILNPTSGEVVIRYAYGAVRLTPASAPELASLIAELARRAGLGHVPALFPTPRLQAMATGSREAPSMAVTSGRSIGSRPVRSLPFSRMRSRTYVTTTCSSCA